MASEKSADKSLLAATKVLYETLSSLDEPSRKRVISSVFALLGIDTAGFKSEASTLPQTPTALRGAHSTSDRPLSPLELIQQKHPSTHPERLAVFAYYREKFEGFSRFARADLRAYYAKAKLQPPQNFDRDFTNAVKTGYIYEDGSESYLTSKGLEAVEVGFAGKPTPKRTSATKAKPRKSTRREHNQ